MSQDKSIRGGTTTELKAIAGPPSLYRLCRGDCGEIIPQKRLVAVPNATLCVACLQKAGDVAAIRRFDEYTPDGDRVETMFTDNSRVQSQLNHFRRAVPNDLAFEQAVGDDYHLTVEIDEGLDIARSLTTAFEDDEPTPEQRRPGRRRIIHQQHDVMRSMATSLPPGLQVAA